MTAPNHIVGGLTITGVFASFTGLNILADTTILATTIIASLSPDIDHPKSLIGKIFYPIARWINRHYGHRTITHSLLTLVFLSAITYIACSIFELNNNIPKTFFIAYLSHLLLDMMTLQGVPLFYPFYRNPCVLPGNPELRFKTANIRTETALFCVLCCSLIFLQPLMQTGFWTQYNRLFGTPKHLASEMKKSKQAVIANYEYKEGSQLIKGKAYAVEVNGNEVVLLKENKWLLFNKNQFIDILPEPSNKELRLKTIHYQNISIDSMNQLVQNRSIREIKAHANTSFIVKDDLLQKETKSYIADYQNKVFFKNTPALPPSETFIPQQSPQIQTLQLKIQKLKAKYQRALKEHQHNQVKKQALENRITQESTDLYRKEIAIKELRKFKASQAPTPIQDDINLLETQISILQQKDNRKNKIRQLEIAKKHQASLPTKTQLSGSLTYITIE